VSGPDRLIADALRELAEQAAAPRQTAAVAWRAGRRRRLAAMGASAVGAAAAVAAATVLLLPLATGSGPVHPRHAGPGVPAAAPAVPISLRSPIQLRQVATIDSAPCGARSNALPGGNPPACFHLTGTGMTLTRVEAEQVAKAGPAHYTLSFILTPADMGPFTALTGKLVGLPSPRDQLAIIIGGRVVAHPAVAATVRGDVQISGFASRAQAEQLLQSLRSG
jgi:hypothetical protein